MIGTEQARELQDATVYSADGDKIGKVGAVFLDDHSGALRFATVRTGLFGNHETFVPLDSAKLVKGDVTVPYEGAMVKDAPRIDADNGHLTPQHEAELYRYYGITPSQAAPQQNGDQKQQAVRPDATAADPSMMQGRHSPGTGAAADAAVPTGAAATGQSATGQSTAGRDRGTADEGMIRSEEQLRVGTEQVESGRARLRKYVVTEEVQQTVPVRRERVRVEHEPITDAERSRVGSTGGISEAEQEIILHEERPVVQKETVPVERVRLTTETETEQQQVTEQVRKEQIEEVLPENERRTR